MSARTPARSRRPAAPAPRRAAPRRRAVAGRAPVPSAVAAEPAAPPWLHRHTLMAINRPVFLARRQAAYGRASNVLRHDLVAAGARKERARLYTLALRLLDDAITVTQRAQLRGESSVLPYLRLLRETVSANLALVNHEMLLVREAAAFSRLLGTELFAKFRIAEDAFSDGERRVLDCIASLLEFGDALMARDLETVCARFEAEDTRRFALAQTEYGAYYRRL